MCYAIPGNIIDIEGSEATIDYGGVIKKVNIGLIDNAQVNDYVLIHAGFAIEKLDRRSAEKSLAIIREYMAESYE
ncbi:MAG: HypC/HybG/HupF family hydrogenase formation chaperone, partial [Methanosarcinales archaeon]|jgi:hydrogenase expression/formation protein HypC|nr:HypC/HybG/HupF family hydrogenase formation chaperone [Methanosarcinales archaeon]